MKTIWSILISYLLCINAFSQVLYEKHFVKKDRIIFRILPENKQTLEFIRTGPLKVTRFEIKGSTLINETTIELKLAPYHLSDTLNWLKLMRKDENLTAFAYQTLYQNNIQTKVGPKEKQSQENIFFNLLMLACDFDSQLSKACGLYFVDSTINSTKKYEYKIEYYNSPKTFKKMLAVQVDASTLSQNKNIVDLSAKNKNNTVVLKWKALNYKASYAGFNIERSIDSINYAKINLTPIILLRTQFEKNKEFIFYSDTVPKTNIKYYYRIKGVNFFGEESDFSNIVSVFNYAEIKSIPMIDSINVINNTFVYLKWKMGFESENSQIKKYLLLKAEKERGPYKTIFESTYTYSYSDKNPYSGGFYKIAAIKATGDTLFSYSRMAIIIDTIPPSTPKGLRAICDEKGNLTISWKKNKESDFQGYKLFKANSKSEEMVQVNSKFITDTFYTDKLKLNTLTKNIYFSMSSCDNNYNTSLRCEKIEVKRPDTIRPIAPNLLTSYPTLNGVNLKFILSQSDDVFTHKLIRKENNEKIEFNLSDTAQSFIDNTVVVGNRYSYYITAIDDAGNFSNSNEIQIYFENGYRKKLSEVNYIVDRKLKNVSLLWNYELNGIEKFILYRAKENEPLSIIKTLGGTERIYIDKTPNIGNVYEYRIKAVLFNGAESLISDPIKVIY